MHGKKAFPQEIGVGGIGVCWCPLPPPPPPLPFPTALIKSVFASSYTERKQVQKSF